MQTENLSCIPLPSRDLCIGRRHHVVVTAYSLFASAGLRQSLRERIGQVSLMFYDLPHFFLISHRFFLACTLWSVNACELMKNIDREKKNIFAEGPVLESPLNLRRLDLR